MGKFKKCLMCQKKINEEQECCPYCGMEWNFFFTSKESRLKWKMALEMDKKRRFSRIYVGVGGILILSGDGVLYGYGDNSQGQYDPAKVGGMTDGLVKIAENVISAAAGYNYSLYVSEDGQVHMLGDSGIPYRERFPGFSNAVEVFADMDKDAFFVLSDEQKLYGWGCNIDRTIEPKQQKTIYVFPDLFEIKYRWHEWGQYKYYEASRGYGRYECIEKGESEEYNGYESLTEALQQKIIGIYKTDIYQTYRREFSSENLKIEYKSGPKENVEENDHDYGEYKEKNKIEKIPFVFKIKKINNHLFSPVPVMRKQTELPSKCSGLSINNKSNHLCDTTLTDTVKRIEKVQNGRDCHYVCLTRQGVLFDAMGNCSEKLFELKDVTDVCVGNEVMYLIMMDGRVLMGKTFDFLETKGIQNFEVLGVI